MASTGVQRASRVPVHPEDKRNPFTSSAARGRTLSALQLPFFLLRPPAGYGVLTTTGRRRGLLHTWFDDGVPFVVELIREGR